MIGKILIFSSVMFVCVLLNRIHNLNLEILDIMKTIGGKKENVYNSNDDSNFYDLEKTVPIDNFDDISDDITLPSKRNRNKFL